MKAVISNRIYLETDRRLQNAIQEELTYNIPTYGDSADLVIHNYSVFRPGIMSLPVGRVDLIPEHYEIVDKRVTKEIEYPEFQGTLRPSQAAVYDDIDDNALINAKVSWGKTFTGLAIAGKLKQKTLIILHTVPLMTQWAKDIRKVYGFEPGMIGNGKDHHDAPITVGSVRSLYNRMHLLSKEFGTLIMDEVHHAPAPIFNKIVDRSYARYKIGLSGTLIRKDGRHVVLKDYFGSKVYTPPKENCMTPKVHVYDTGIYFPDSQELGWSAKVTALQESVVYRNLVANLSQRYAQQGHKVIVVGDRVEFLKHVSERVNGALIVGDVKDRDAEFVKMETTSDVLCGTQSILSEGISHDPLSALLMATPINNMPLLEQLVGRIIRLCPGKQQPIIVEMRLRGRTVEKQFMNRLGHYMEQGYEIDFIK